MDRKDIISEMREKRKSYKEIGEILGVSKQRIHQIYKDYCGQVPQIKNKVLERDKNKCSVCDSVENLEVHHVNGLRRDNRLENLVTLCRKCHLRIEGQDRKKFKPIEKKFYRKKDPRLCSKCSDVHHGKGLCKKHYNSMVWGMSRKKISR